MVSNAAWSASGVHWSDGYGCVGSQAESGPVFQGRPDALRRGRHGRSRMAGTRGGVGASSMKGGMTREEGGDHAPPLPSADVSVVLERMSSGRLDAGHDLLPLVCTQLRAAAQSQIDREAAGHTLSAAAAQAMRRVLIDHARAKHAQRRGAIGIGLCAAKPGGCRGGRRRAAVSSTLWWVRQGASSRRGQSRWQQDRGRAECEVERHHADQLWPG